MADPRTRLKSFTVKQCAGAAGTGGTSSQERKDFFNNLGKIGDLEFLNNSDLGSSVGEGLRGLARVSNSIRIGDGALPSALGSAVDKGAGFVLDAIGIAPGVIDTLKPLNPDVVNRAVAQAEVIWDDVKEGKYKLEDIPDTFSDLQNLERLARGIYTPASERATGPAVCEASPWAMDLDPFFPKYKFLFLVQFWLNPPYDEIKKNQSNMFEFVIKQSTRPNINFEYEEVNMYNFRTQVAKRTIYEPMTMRFYDDNINRIMQFYSIYLKAMSPIANQAFKQKMEGSDWYEQSGMNFNNPQTSPVQGINTNVYSGSLGALEGDATKTVISRINLFHIYSMGRKANKYTFFNPKITSMELDELDMSEGTVGNEIALQFNYDGMFLAPGMTIEERGKVGDTNLTDWQLASGAQYPFHNETNGEFVKPEPEPGGALPGEEMENTVSGISVDAEGVTLVPTDGSSPSVAQQVGAGIEATERAISEVQQQGQNAKASIVNSVKKTAVGALNATAGAAAGLFGRGPRKL